MQSNEITKKDEKKKYYLTKNVYCYENSAFHYFRNLKLENSPAVKRNV